MSIRLPTKAKVARFKAAAKLRRWPLNTLIVAGAEALANQILAEAASGEVGAANQQNNGNPEQESAG